MEDKFKGRSWGLKFRADGEEVDPAQMKASDSWLMTLTVFCAVFRVNQRRSNSVKHFVVTADSLLHHESRWDDCGGPCWVHRLHPGCEVEKLSHHTFRPLKLLKVDSQSVTIMASRLSALCSLSDSTAQRVLVSSMQTAASVLLLHLFILVFTFFQSKLKKQLQPSLRSLLPPVQAVGCPDVSDNTWMGADAHVAAGGTIWNIWCVVCSTCCSSRWHISPSAVTFVTDSVTCVSSDPIAVFFRRPDVDSQCLKIECDCNICVTHMDGNVYEETADVWSH